MFRVRGMWHRCRSGPLCGAILLAYPGVAATSLGLETESEPPVASETVELSGLQNVLRVGPDLVNGSAPENDAGFDSLQRLGIKAIVCVDGGAPDIERASARGIRCVHLPIGYDGVDPEQARRLMRAVRDLPKPIYMHCLHGKHRSPAAAGVVAVGLGWMSPEAALGVLRTAGTSPKYEGLYESVRTTVPISMAELDSVPADFPERATITDLVKGMVEIGEVFEHLEKLEDLGWKAPADHPDLDPRNEARILRELLTQLITEEADRRRPEGFVAGLRKAQSAAAGLLDAFKAGHGPNDSTSLNRVRISCQSCHERFRD